MESEWDSVPLCDLYEYRSGLSKARGEFGSGYPFLSFKDVFYNSFVPSELTELVQSTEQEREACSVRRGDVFLTRTSETMDELGMSCVALADIDGATFNGFCKRLRPKPGVVISPEYAAYYFQTPQFRRAVTSMTSMSTRASLNNSMIDRLTMLLAPPEAQESIGRTLKNLDDKIELNRKMNHTLEAMAQALFKSWFVDFDPVIDNALRAANPIPDDLAEKAARRKAVMARDSYSVPEYAGLFPDAFEDSKLGAIPRGWDYLPVKATVEAVFDGPHATPAPSPTGAVFLGIKNLTGTGLDLATIRRIADVDWPRWTKRVEPRQGDIVFCYEARLGDFALLPPGLRCCLGRRMALIRPSDDASNKHFLFHYFVAEPFQRFLRSHVNPGSTVDRILLKDFPKYPVLSCPQDLVNRFEAVADPVWTRIHKNQAEAQTLGALRDSLLPMLISGEIRVPADVATKQATETIA